MPITALLLMALILLGLALLGAFAWLSEAARHGSSNARVLAAWEAFGLTAVALLGLFLALALLGLRCDESCGGDEGFGGGWTHTSDAWQWWGQFAAAGLGFAAVCAAFVQTLRRRHPSATRWMVGAAASFGVWTIFLAPFGDRFGI